jgi:hypothetical protein
MCLPNRATEAVIQIEHSYEIQSNCGCTVVLVIADISGVI